MFNGETFDGGLAHRLRRWDTPNRAASWSSISVRQRVPCMRLYLLRLSAALVPPTLKSVPQAPASTRGRAASVVLDCGQNGAGWSQLNCGDLCQRVPSLRRHADYEH